jgi:hypothetical protein
VTRAWTRATPSALFVGSIARSERCVVVAGAAGTAAGALGIVLLLVPGQVCARIAVMPSALAPT